MRGAGHGLHPSRHVVGDEVRLRALWWEGPLPDPGDLMQTSTGRRYLIQQIGPRGSGRAFTLRCIIVASDCALPPGHKLFRWTWTRKSTRLPKAFRRRS